MKSDSSVMWSGAKGLAFLLAVVAVGGFLLLGRDAISPSGDGAPESDTPGNESQDALRGEFDRAKAQAESREAAIPPVKSTDTIIAEHTAKLEQNPEPDDAAALLSALGNLHKQKKQDYAAAARYFEQVIEKYPDWPGINGVYHQLMACYSNLDDQVSLRLLYRKMMEVFPEESNEYMFAKDALK